MHLRRRAAVRALKEIDGREADGRPLSLDTAKAQNAAGTGAEMRLVLFMTAGRVIASAEQMLR